MPQLSAINSTDKVSTYIRFNQEAINEVLGKLDTPVRGFRILY